MREEKDEFVSENGRERITDIGGSPSPAPRPRPIGGSQRERDEQRMRRLREGMRVVTSSPLGQNGENDTVSPLEEDDTIGSNGNEGSGLSPEDEFTDQWLNEMKRAASDQERITIALNSQKPLFARGGLGTRVTETAQTLVRKSSASSLESEPGVRIPRTWGRHAKKNPGWLNRISSPESSEEVFGLPQQVVSEGSIDWAGAAVDAPPPSVEIALQYMSQPPLIRDLTQHNIRICQPRSLTYGIQSSTSPRSLFKNLPAHNSRFETRNWMK
jgi:hypothetical protein